MSAAYMAFSRKTEFAGRIGIIKNHFVSEQGLATSVPQQLNHWKSRLSEDGGMLELRIRFRDTRDLRSRAHSSPLTVPLTHRASILWLYARLRG